MHLLHRCFCALMTVRSIENHSFDRRTTLPRSEAKQVYDAFAASSHTGGDDAASGYGGPAIQALVSMADFPQARTVVDYGCGQGKLAQLVLQNPQNSDLQWIGIDQSPKMVERFQERAVASFPTRCRAQLALDGDPSAVTFDQKLVDRFVSTYCLDLLSERDMYAVLDLAEECLDPERGLLLLAGITWGYRLSLRTFLMTAVWEFLYVFFRRKVGGCRPQKLVPYLKARGWEVKECVTTLPRGYPWMASEVLSARPPARGKKRKEKN